jgi:hypothetical protein
MTTFLRGKKFQGGMRPTVLVKTLKMRGHEVDVLIVRNSTATPFVVVSDFSDPPGGGSQPRRVRANNVYTRIQDGNTPIDETADLDKVEYLWRKRFGIHRTALERFETLLDSPAGWEWDDSRALFFYKYAPEFVIQISDSYWQEDHETREAHKRSEFYCKLFPDSDGYHWEDFEIKYHQTVIYEGNSAFLDGARHLIAIPERDTITSPDDHIESVLGRRYVLMYYYDLSQLTGKINRLFVFHYAKRGDLLGNPLGQSVIVFEDSIEKSAFSTYLSDHLTELDGIQTFKELEASHGGRRGADWPETVEEWQRQTMVNINRVFDQWRDGYR